jgi:branched-chain amino acid transport system substrate-binding protein
LIKDKKTLRRGQQMRVMKSLLVLTALFLIVPAVVFGQQVAGVSDKEVVVGVTTPLSGPAAHWGTTALGMKAWADYVNAQGGVHGRKIKVIIKDDAYNPTRGMANLQEMKGNVFAFCGVLGTAICSAAKDFFGDNKIPLVTAYANVRLWLELPKEKRKYVFIAYTDYRDEAEYAAKYAVNKLGSKKIAVFYQNDDYGKNAVEGVNKALAGLAGKASLVEAVPFELSDRALGAHALKLKETGADTVIIYPTMTHAALIMKEMAKIAYKPKTIFSFPIGDPIMYKLAGAEVWEGAYIALPGNTGVPGAEPEADKVAEILVKHDPNLKGKEFLAVFGATSMMHLVEGLKNAGRNLTVDSFMAGMEKIKDWKPQGMGAPVTYSPDRRHGVNASRMGQAQKGKHMPLEKFTVFAPLF